MTELATNERENHKTIGKRGRESAKILRTTWHNSSGEIESEGSTRMLQRFNFKALRDKQWGGPSASAVGLVVSRRELFGMIGAALPSTLRRDEPFRWQQNGRSVSFLIG